MSIDDSAVNSIVDRINHISGTLSTSINSTNSTAPTWITTTTNHTTPTIWITTTTDSSSAPIDWQNVTISSEEILLGYMSENKPIIHMIGFKPGQMSRKLVDKMYIPTEKFHIIGIRKRSRNKPSK